MTEWDLEPIAHPETVHYRDALQKGLGRALLWAKKGKWREKAILREACLTDLRYDRQCEEARGPWLWRIMEVTGVIEDFREAILESLRTLDDGLAARQLCQFCVFYAQRGEERFRHRLQEIVSEKPVPDCPWLGEEELIVLDGEAGFLFAVRVRGRSLLHREWDWDDRSVIDMAFDKLGEQATVALLERESAFSADIGRFRDQWQANAEEKAAGDPKQSHADRMRQYTLNDVIQMAENTRNRAMSLRGWGMYADERNLETILNRLFNCEDSDAIANYLRVFSNRPLPHFDRRLLDLLEHENEQVRSWAYMVAAQNSHPDVRRFALDHLSQRITERNFIQLFIRNFQSGDEDLLLKELSIPEDPQQCHGLLMNVIKVLEQNPAARRETLALLAYLRTPCASCRFRAVKLLVTQNIAPRWLIEECQYDSDSETRGLVAESCC